SCCISNVSVPCHGVGVQRQLYAELASHAHIAFRPDSTTMLLNYAAHDRQPQPGSAFPTCVGTIDLLASLESRLQLVPWSSTALTPNPNYHAQGSTLRRKFYPTPPRREFDRVSQQIDDSLHHTFLISIDRS